jgi:hypothetical protein
MSVNEMARPRPAPSLLGLRLEALRKKAQGACDAHISKTPETITTIGIDLGKNPFHLVGLDKRGAIALQRKVSRSQLEHRLSNVPRCLIGMEACSGSHHIGRQLTALGHDVRLIPAQHVKPFLKGHKNNCRDAEAVCGSRAATDDEFRADQNSGANGSAGFASCALAPRGPTDGDDQSNPRLPIERGIIVRQGVIPLRKALPDILSSNKGIGRLGCTIFRRGVWVGCRRLLRLLADRDDVRRRLPDLFIGQDISPGRHTEAPLLSAIGNRLEDVLGVKLALRQIDAASAVCPMTMGTLLS